MESRRKNQKNATDRLSNIPAEIIYRIFSFLHMDDISRVGMLSKELREVYLLGPYLKFGSTCNGRDCPSSALCQQFCSKVDPLLGRRKGLAIHSLSLVWMCNVRTCGSYVSPVERCIAASISCPVQELEIQVGLRRGVSFFLPRAAINYRSLRVLKLNLSYAKLGKPSSGVLCSLGDLILEAVEVDNPSLSKWISVDKCPLLKRLFLVNFRWIDKTLYIRDPSSIEELTIREPQSSCGPIIIKMEKLLSLDVYLTQLTTKNLSVLTIAAPKLQVFGWKEKPYSIACCAIFHNLKSAYLDIEFDPVYTIETATDEEKILIVDNCINLLHSMHSARELQVNLEIFEILFFNNLLDVVLGELQHLVIVVKRLRGYHFHVLASIINRCPKLETLSLTCNGKADGYKVNWHANEIFKNHDGFESLVRHKLTHIEIELQCLSYDVRLLEKMLKLVPGLKKMTLFCSRKYQHTCCEIQLLLSRKFPVHFEVSYI